MTQDEQQKIKIVEGISIRHTIIIAVACLVVGGLAVWVAQLNRRVNNHLEHINKDIKVLKEDVTFLKDDMKGIQGGITKLGKDIKEYFSDIHKRLPALPEK